MTRLTPDGHTAPYPAYTCDTHNGIHISLSGIQAKTATLTAPVYEQLSSLIKQSTELLHNEHTFHFDPQGYRNDIMISYWNNPDSFKTWFEAYGNHFFTSQTPQTGLWFEAMSCQRDRFETSSSTKAVNWGISRYCKVMEDPVHGYYGAMRDRIVAAENGGLAGSVDRLNRSVHQETQGRHLTIQSLPDNLCFIRTIQGWRDCSKEEKAWFLKNSYPVYKKGVEFLQTHPLETNCISARLVNNAEKGSHMPQTETLAWFLSLADLENWAWNHPTHAAIHKSAITHANTFNFRIDVLLGHEALVIAKDNIHARYINCHNRTGFLAFFNATAIP